MKRWKISNKPSKSQRPSASVGVELERLERAEEGLCAGWVEAKGRVQKRTREHQCEIGERGRSDRSTLAVFSLAETESADSNPIPRVLDRAALFAQFGDDLDLIKAIVPLFLQDAAVMLSSIRDSIASADSLALQLAAHKLKGSVSNFHARPAVAASQRLEDIGKCRNTSGAPQALAVLENEMHRLEAALVDLTRESATTLEELEP